MNACLFCEIVAGTRSAARVLEDDDTVAFLDRRPLFKGHVLIVPRKHVETLGDLPDELLAPLLRNTQRLSIAVERALDAQGSLVALNNRVSQSVPHLHVHVVPRRKGDGLKGFFWPRTRYDSDQEMDEIAGRLRAALN